jgi:hypothetical protein
MWPFRTTRARCRRLIGGSPRRCDGICLVNGTRKSGTAVGRLQQYLAVARQPPSSRFFGLKKGSCRRVLERGNLR